VAEVDGNRTRQTELLGLAGVEDRGTHQDAYTSTPPARPNLSAASAKQNVGASAVDAPDDGTSKPFNEVAIEASSPREIAP